MYVLQVYDCENPMTEEDGNNAFHDPEMGEIYFSHDSGILMRSINEDDTPPLKKQQQKQQQQQAHTYIHVKSHHLLLHGSCDDNNYSASNAAMHGKGDVWRATAVEHVAVTLILWYVHMYVCMYVCMYV